MSVQFSILDEKPILAQLAFKQADDGLILHIHITLSSCVLKPKQKRHGLVIKSC